MGKRSVGMLLLGACVALVLPILGHAASTPWKVVADSPQAFEVQAAKVRKDMGPHGQYGGISLNDRTAVGADLDQIDALLRKRGSASKLNDSDQVALMNAQERINAVLTRNEGNRLVCTLEARTGTNFKQKVCRTQAEIDSVRRKSQQGFQDALMRNGATQMKGN